MGGKPQYFLVSIGIPSRHMVSDIHELYKGILKLAKEFRVAVSRWGHLFINEWTHTERNSGRICKKNNKAFRGKDRGQYFYK